MLRGTGIATELLYALGEEEVGEDPVVRVDVGLAVRRDAGRRDRVDAGRIGRHQLLPRLALSRRRIEQEDPRGILGAVVHVEPAVGRPAETALAVPKPLNGDGLAAVDRIDVALAIRTNRDDSPAVARDGLADRTVTLRRDRSRLSVFEVPKIEASPVTLLGGDDEE